MGEFRKMTQSPGRRPVSRMEHLNDCRTTVLLLTTGNTIYPDSLQHLRTYVTFLAAFAPECATIRHAQVRLMQGNIAPRTYSLGMHQPMLFEYKCLFPLKELKAVLARLLHQFSLFCNRQSCYR